MIISRVNRQNTVHTSVKTMETCHLVYYLYIDPTVTRGVSKGRETVCPVCVRKFSLLDLLRARCMRAV